MSKQAPCCEELVGQVARLEDALRDFRAIFNHVQQFVGVLDPEGRVLDVNRAALAFAGVRKEEVKGLYFADTPCWAHSAEVQSQVRQALARAVAGESAFFVAVQKGGDGLPHHVDSSFVPVKSGGRVVYLVYEGRDISARIRFEEALRVSEEQYRNIFEAAQDGFFIMGRDRRLVEVNSAICRMHGYPREEMLGLDLLTLVHPDEQKFYQEMLRDLNQGHSFAKEGRHLRRDNSSFPVDLHVSPISYHGTPHLFGVVRDISERRQAETEKRRLEAQLRQAQKMEALGTLAGGIAHDFNNILTAIMGYTDLATYLLPGESPVREHLQAVSRAGFRARTLVEQILTFSRQGEQVRRPMEISPVIKEALKLLRASLPSTIAIRQKISGETGTILADPGQIHQIFFNLCTNAAEAMEETGGILEVELCAEEGDSGKQIRLTVRDTGPGIAPELQERIFDPFFTTKERGKGTGLGLAMVHGLVESHGGTITVESNPGCGAAFHLRFPAVQGEGKVAQQQFDTRPPPGGTERILVVDDEEAVLALEKELLESLGYTVNAFPGSMEALEFFSRQGGEIDLVITDQTMPLVSGALLIREMRKIRADIPIILCTGHSSVMDEKKAMDLGVKEFLMKPFDVRKLATTVRRALEDDRP